MELENYNTWNRLKKHYLGRTTIGEVLADFDLYQGNMANFEHCINENRKVVIKL